jgi:hypothetical protein
MKRKIIIAAGLLAILAVVALAFVILSSVPSTVLYVDPQTVQGTISESFTVNISISKVTDLYGWEFKLSWNTSLLNVTNVSEGSMLRSNGNTFFAPQLNSTAGHLIADCTLVTPIGSNVSGVSGDGMLLIVQFQVKGSGACDLNLYDTQLLDPNGQHISHMIHNGRFST